VLPRIIEFIESLRRPGGGYIADHTGGEIIIPAFPGLTTIELAIRPFESTGPGLATTGSLGWALIGYKISVCQTMIPNAFSFTIQIGGKHMYTGNITQTIMDEGLNVYSIITSASPLMVQISNLTNVNQYFDALSQYIDVTSSDDMAMIQTALNNLAMQDNHEFQAEALKLLRTLANVPQPPLGVY